MTYAMTVLKQQLQNAREERAFIEAEKKDEIEAGLRAQRDVDHAVQKVEDLERAIDTLEHADRAEVNDE